MHKRLFYLDNLKTFALLLGVLFHTSIIYAPNVGYAIKSEDLNYFFSILVHLIHVFRMPLFFFLSGFFSYMVLTKKGGRNFTFSRLERMFAPMLAGLFSFAPIQYYLVYNQSHAPVSFWNYYPNFFSFEEFDFSHIWFLVYLFIYSFFLIINYKTKLTDKISKISIFNRLKKFSNRLERSYPVYNILFLKAVFFCFGSILLTNLFFNKDYSILRIKPVSFFYYLSFFSIGVITYKKNLLQVLFLQSESRISKNKSSFIIIGLLLLFAIYLYLDEIDPYWMDFNYEIKKILFRTIHLSIDSILAWSFIFILLFVFKNYLDHTGPTLDYLRNSGMSIYLVHHPVSLLLGEYLIKIKIPIFLKFTIHTLLVFILSFFFYQFIIKKSFILKRVFGTK